MLALFVLALPVANGCTRRTSAPSSPPEPLAVAAASDLQIALPEIAAIFERETGRQVRFSFGSTGTLARQIEQGAPFDVFAAANADFIDALASQGRVERDSVARYARGYIVLAWRKGSAKRLERPQDLLDPAVRFLAIANPQHAPYGKAARQALEREALWEPLGEKILLAENIRQAVLMIEMGNADAGLIARSLAGSSELDWAAIDESLYDPIEQEIAIVAERPHMDLARRFVGVLLSPEGQEVLARFGFGPPGESP